MASRTLLNPSLHRSRFAATTTLESASSARTATWYVCPTRSIVPVFPGYLFFVATETQRYLAMTTNRIAGTLSVPRQEELVAQLRHLHTVLASATGILRSPRIRTGRWVRIIAGPLAGVEGVVRGWRSRLRVALNVDILGQSVIVETDADLVELIEPPVYAAQTQGDKPKRPRKGKPA